MLAGDEERSTALAWDVLTRLTPEADTTRREGAAMTSQQSFDAALHQILTLLFRLRKAVQEQTKEIAELRAELQPAPRPSRYSPNHW